MKVEVGALTWPAQRRRGLMRKTTRDAVKEMKGQWSSTTRTDLTEMEGRSLRRSVRR